MIRCVHVAINRLSGRSLEIATLALEGKSNPEITDKLGISLNSVKSLKKEMYTKLRKIIGHEYIILFFVICILIFFSYHGKGKPRTVNKFRQ